MGWILAIVFFVLWIVRLAKSKDDATREYRKGRDETVAYLLDRLRRKPGKALTEDDIARIINGEEDDGDAAAYTAAVTHMREPVAGPSVDPDATPYDETAQVYKPYVPEPQPAYHAPTATERQAATLRNLNTVLYAASFLLVAAAAVFVFTAGDPVLKLATLIIVTAAFYGAGIAIHLRAKTLRPAAAAFAGTGLAILPFTGIALSAYGGVPAGVSWLIVSAVGLALFYLAALVLGSSTVAYLTLGFVLSLCLSVVNVGGVGFVWYFVVLVAVSTGAALVSAAFPTKIPALFSRPISLTGQAITPLTVLVSLCLPGALSIASYELIFSVMTLGYLAVWLQRRTYMTEIIARVALQATLIAYAIGFAPSNDVLALLIIAGAAAHAVFGLLRYRAYPAGEQNNVLVQMAVVVAAGFLAAGSGREPEIIATALSIAGAIGFAAALRFRHSGWAYVTLGMSFIVPLLAGRLVIEPVVSWGTLAGYFTGMAVVALAVAWAFARQRRTRLVWLCTVGFIGYAFIAYACALTQSVPWVTAIVAIILAAAVYGISYVVRAAWAGLVASLLVITAAANASQLIAIAGEWRLIAAAATAGVILAAVAAVQLKYRQTRRSAYSLIGSVAALATGIFALALSDQQVAVTLWIAYSLLAIGFVAIRAARRIDDTMLRTTVAGASYVFAGLAVLAGWSAGEGWAVAAYGLTATLLYAGSHVDRVRWLIVVANAFLLGTLATAADLSGLGYGWAALVSTGVFVVLMTLLDAAYVATRDTPRQWYVLGSLWAVAAWAWLSYGSAEHPYDVIAAGIGLVGALSMVVHGYETRRPALLESGVYVATLAAQWAVSRLAPDLDLTLYAYWWAVTIIVAGLALRRRLIVHAAVAMGLVTAVLGIYALSGRKPYALIFLAQHVAYVIVGFALAKRWVIWWGIAATIVGVLYFLRSYTYLWLGLLGILLIGFVVWKLVQQGKKTGE